MADDKPTDVEMADAAEDAETETKKKSSKSGSAPRFEIKKWNAGALPVMIWRCSAAAAAVIVYCCLICGELLCTHFSRLTSSQNL